MKKKTTMSKFDKAALEYHSAGKPGKVDVQSSKACDTEYALSLAYSPGVAVPCKVIAKKPEKAYEYTTKGNLVGVVTNGSAVLGLGNIGPLAGKPVMEGKGVLFKQFANIDVFDLELQTDNIEEFIQAVKSLEPTFGGINLEDIKAPDCFEIEERLKAEMNIPVFHDDQHGTAIITGAGLLNACKVSGKKLKKIKVVFNGAGAAAIACAKLFLLLGVPKKNITICDSRGVIYKGRTDGMNPYKEQFAVKTDDRTLADALVDADVFVGLSVAGVLSPKMLKSMNDNPVVFALANPDPEITPPEALKVRKDIIIATGRTDFPNQVNNVLGFPSIFRGALDVHATHINEEMKLAAVKALAELAEEPVPDSVSSAYNDQQFNFGPEYLIPKPFDPRVLMTVAPAVAKAAMDSGVARKPLSNLEKYKEELEAFQGFGKSFIRRKINRIKTFAKRKRKDLPRIVFPEGKSQKILKALNSIAHEQVIQPILLGNEDEIREIIKELELDSLHDIEIIKPEKSKMYSSYVETFFDLRQRKGVMLSEAERLLKDPYYFAAMMVKNDDADGTISGAQQNYADCIRPLLEIIGTSKRRLASGLNVVLVNEKVYFFADTTVNINPSAEDLATIAIHTSEVAKYFEVEPEIAMLSFSNFTADKENPKKMKKAMELVKEAKPKLIIDGEMQADTAVNPEIVERIFPFCNLKKGANVLIFPNLDAGNISYKLVQQLSGAEVMGPFLMGMRRAAHILQRSCQIEDIVNTIVITALHSQAVMEYRGKKSKTKTPNKKQ